MAHRRVLLALAIALAGAPIAGAQADTRSLGSGAWSYFMDPRAVHTESPVPRTFVGVADDRGDIRVIQLDETTGAASTYELHARLGYDDHNSPGLVVREDGRLMAFYSRHNGRYMYHRTSLRRWDATAWGPEETVPVNVPGTKGFTYANPLRLRTEPGFVWLLVRGANQQPMFTRLGPGGWEPARNLVTVPLTSYGVIPYATYGTDGIDTIHVNFTDSHPNWGPSSIYYMRYRAGRFERADGTLIGTPADAPFTPAQADLVHDAAATGVPAWTMDVGSRAGKPVLLYATYPSAGDHRYWYARWDGVRWRRHEIMAAGGSMSFDGDEPQYSGGLTLDPQDASTVILSRARTPPTTGPNSWTLERRHTPDGGATWQTTSLPGISGGLNARPLVPRGAGSTPPPLVWMGGPASSYFSYVTYHTNVLIGWPDASNHPPVADASAAPATGTGPLAVRLDATTSSDHEGSSLTYAWDLGDGTTASGPLVDHTYPVGTYVVRLRVTDAAGLTSELRTEVRAK